MTTNPVTAFIEAAVEILGGVRATIFACLAVALLVTTGVQHLRIAHKNAYIKTIEAQSANYRQANLSNLDTIATLKGRIKDLVKAWAWDQSQAAAAAQRAAEAAAKTNAQLAATQAELEGVYAKFPKARAWGAAAVDPAVAAKLPAGGRAH